MKVLYGDRNVGDTLSPIILEGLTKHRAEKAQADDTGKLVMVGSFLDVVKDEDILLGVGSNKPEFTLSNVPSWVISVRGPLTAAQIPFPVPKVYGDPALLLPKIYNPKIKPNARRRPVGTIPHYIDWPLFAGREYIDISQPWQSLIDEMLLCDHIVSSSLHGIVIAEAYGIPATWDVYSNNIAGGQFKFQDYFLGTGRGVQTPGQQLDPIPNLDQVKQNIMECLNQL